MNSFYVSHSLFSHLFCSFSLLPLLPFLPMLPLLLRFPPYPLFHIKLFFIEAHAAWNSIPPGAVGWNTRLFWAQAKQMLALGVQPETSLRASLFLSVSLFHSSLILFLLLIHVHVFCLFSSYSVLESSSFFLVSPFLDTFSHSIFCLTQALLTVKFPNLFAVTSKQPGICSQKSLESFWMNFVLQNLSVRCLALFASTLNND